MFKFILILGALLFSNFMLLAQDEKEATEEEEGKNIIAITAGYTYIPSAGELSSAEADGFFVPTIGLDYFRVLHEKWEIGYMVDFELGSYFIIDKDLPRERALIMALAVAYRITPKLKVVVAGGAEWEENKNLAVIRLGAERGFKLGNGWALGPAFFFDFKEGYDTWSLSLGIGKEF